MKLPSLSASSARVYELCPMRWAAEHQDKMPTMSGSAAGLGTACHMSLEHWVRHGHHLMDYDEATALDVMQKIYDVCYWQCFATSERYREGLELVFKWLKRQDWEGRKVLHVEEKRRIDLPTKYGPVPFSFIFDREDRLANGDIEIIDYKTLSMPVYPSALKEMIQPRAYATVAYVLHPDAERVWMTFDMLRHDPVGIVFTKEECRATYLYMRGLAERIIEDNDPVEILNDECHWCSRRNVCKTLQWHVENGGSLSTHDPVEAAKLKYNLSIAAKAIKQRMEDLDKVLVGHLEGLEAVEFDAGDYEVSLGGSRRREVNSTSVAAILGPAIATRYAKFGVGELDELLKDPTLTDEVKSQLRQQMTWTTTSVSPRVKKKK